MADCCPRIWPCSITPKLRSKYFHTIHSACRPHTLLFERNENTKKASVHCRFNILCGVDFTDNVLVLRFYALVVSSACFGRLCNPHRQPLSLYEYKKAHLSVDADVYCVGGIYLCQTQIARHGRLVVAASRLRGVEQPGRVMVWQIMGRGQHRTANFAE